MRLEFSLVYFATFIVVVNVREYALTPPTPSDTPSHHTIASGGEVKRLRAGYKGTVDRWMEVSDVRVQSQQVRVGSNNKAANQATRQRRTKAENL